jgi:hypothetical protein
MPLAASLLVLEKLCSPSAKRSGHDDEINNWRCIEISDLIILNAIADRSTLGT